MGCRRHFYTSACADNEFFLSLWSARLFGERNRQDAILELRLDLVSLDSVRKLEGSLKSTELPLGDVVMLFLLFFVLFAFTSDGQRVSG